jgi:hypothetical protein
MHAFYFLNQITVQSWFLYNKLEYFTKEKVIHITNRFRNLTNFQIVNKTQFGQLHKIYTQKLSYEEMVIDYTLFQQLPTYGME